MGEQDSAQARIDGLLDALRDAEVGFRQSYSRVLEVVSQLDEDKAGAVAGFGTTAGCWPGRSTSPRERLAPESSTPRYSPRASH
jgi:hypothetical protein